jgi:alkylation response protein AidB-like acyl-CoA dehydrogenase
MSFARVLELDETEEYPHAILSGLRQWGLHRFSVPETHGGNAGDVVDGLNLMRTVARRDPTSAAALSLTSLGYAPVWIAGTEEQRTYFADLVTHGTKICWGLSERSHGSDILSNEVSAEPVDGGYLVSGEKWLIGNASIAEVIMLYARTHPKGGPAGYSILAVEKRRAGGDTIQELPKERMHGLRALDMSGVRLNRCFVPTSARVGGEGQGLEIALKASQIARTIINSLALGAVDTALRVTLGFACEREIFGSRVVDIPYSRRQLVECFADLLIADALATGAARSLQVVPAQASQYSSIAKYFVPTMLIESMLQLAIVLGARHYLRDQPRYSIFQKMLRDTPVASFADGNTTVNLKNLALSLEALLNNALEASDTLRQDAVARVAVTFDFDHKLPHYEPWKQDVFGRGHDDTLLAFPHSITRLRARAAAAPEPNATWLGRSADLAERFMQELGRLRNEQRWLRQSRQRTYGQSAELFRLAEQYCAVNAAAVCVHVHAHSAQLLDHLTPSEAVLLVCLERLWGRFHPVDGPSTADASEAAAQVMVQLHKQNTLFSHHSCQLAG